MAQHFSLNESPILTHSVLRVSLFRRFINKGTVINKKKRREIKLRFEIEQGKTITGDYSKMPVFSDCNEINQTEIYITIVLS